MRVVTVFLALIISFILSVIKRFFFIIPGRQRRFFVGREHCQIKRIAPFHIGIRHREPLSHRSRIS